MNAKKALGTLCGLTLIAVPAAGSAAELPGLTSFSAFAYGKPTALYSNSLTEPVPRPVDQPVTKTATEPVSPVSLLDFAAREFHENRFFSPHVQKQLNQQKDALLPYVQSGVRLEPNRYRFPSDVEFSYYDEWQYWVQMACLLDDSRILPAFLAWFADPRPIPDPFLLEQALEELVPKGQEKRLVEMFEKGSGNNVTILLNVLSKRNALSDKQLNEWMRTYRDRPQISGLVSFIVSRPEGVNRLKAWYDPKETAVLLNREIIQHMDIQQESDRVWLTAIAKTTKDPFVEQSIDVRLVYNKGDKEAAKRLYESGMEHGFLFPLNGTVEKFLLGLYPDGLLAKGIKRYQEITGKPYFFGGDQEAWYDAHGTDYAEPGRAIQQWLAFLHDFPKHPAADDAAYRLARCYQLLGQYDKALDWYEQATMRGDKDLTYDASGQFLFVLDVEMSGADFARMDLNKRPEWQQIWLRYTQALDSLRDNNYGRAAQQFRELLELHDGQQVFSDSILNTLPWYNGVAEFSFWDQVKGQLAQTEKRQKLQEEINRLQGAAKAAKQYELAASVYRDELAYYNYLWRGERQTFFWLGHIKEMEYSEALDRYVARFNHFVQAAKLFSSISLDDADEKTGAKTLFSLALCYSKLSDYGDEVKFYATKASLYEQLVQTGEKLLEQYPDSELADDMLLLMYHHSKNQDYLKRLIEKYPNGDKRAEAEEAKPDSYPYKETLSRPPYQLLSEGDWRTPQKVKDWAQAKQGTDFRGILHEGDWTYIYIAAPMGKAVDFGSVETDRNGSHIYYFLSGNVAENQYKRAWSGALLRLPKRFLHEKTVVFEEIK